LCGRDDARDLFIGRREAGGGGRWHSLTPVRRARRDRTVRCTSAETAPPLRANNFRREVGNGYVKIECAADASAPPLPAGVDFWDVGLTCGSHTQNFPPREVPACSIRALGQGASTGLPALLLGSETSRHRLGRVGVSPFSFPAPKSLSGRYGAHRFN
jgi:hypothetical protein